jgi:hypothetical protein
MLTRKDVLRGRSNGRCVKSLVSLVVAMDVLVQRRSKGRPHARSRPPAPPNALLPVFDTDLLPPLLPPVPRPTVRPMPPPQQAALGLGGLNQRPQLVTAERKRKHDELQAAVQTVDAELHELSNQVSELDAELHEQTFEDVVNKTKRIKECHDELANVEDHTKDIIDDVPEMPNEQMANVVKGMTAGSIAFLEKFASAAIKARLDKAEAKALRLEKNVASCKKVVKAQNLQNAIDIEDLAATEAKLKTSEAMRMASEAKIKTITAAHGMVQGRLREVSRESREKDDKLKNVTTAEIRTLREDLGKKDVQIESLQEALAQRLATAATAQIAYREGCQRELARLSAELKQQFASEMETRSQSSRASMGAQLEAHKHKITARLQAMQVEVDALHTRSEGQRSMLADNRSMLAENMRIVAGGIPFPADDTQLSWGRFADAMMQKETDAVSDGDNAEVWDILPPCGSVTWSAGVATHAPLLSPAILAAVSNLAEPSSAGSAAWGPILGQLSAMCQHVATSKSINITAAVLQAHAAERLLNACRGADALALGLVLIQLMSLVGKRWPVVEMDATYPETFNEVCRTVNACLLGNEKSDAATMESSCAIMALLEGLTQAGLASRLRVQKNATYSSGSVILTTEIKLPFLLIVETERRTIQIASKAMFSQELDGLATPDGEIKISLDTFEAVLWHIRCWNVRNNKM